MLLGACSPPPQEPSKDALFERVSGDRLPIFADDLDADSLKQAIQTSLVFLERSPGNQKPLQSELELSPIILKASLVHFLKLLEEGRLSRDAVAREFDVYWVHGPKDPASSLVTGYYEPILEGRLQPDAEFATPLYGLPPDLVSIELAAFDPHRFATERLVGRIQDQQVVPYYTRAEIDGGGKLGRHSCQLLWVKDPVEAFFLHVQGSGMIKLSAEHFQRIGYAGANGRPYRSIGKVLIDKGALSADEMSLQALRNYLRNHPETRDEVLWQNENYVFFRWVKEGPLGSLNLPLTTGRSIATDPRYFPRGALAYLETQQPRLGEDGRVTGLDPLHRWVVNQDAGGAIKGPGRVDLFCGTGQQAEETAGHMKYRGRLFLLVKKGERPD